MASWWRARPRGIRPRSWSTRSRSRASVPRTRAGFEAPRTRLAVRVMVQRMSRKPRLYKLRREILSSSLWLWASHPRGCIRHTSVGRWKVRPASQGSRGLQSTKYPHDDDGPPSNRARGSINSGQVPCRMQPRAWLRWYQCCAHTSERHPSLPDAAFRRDSCLHAWLLACEQLGDGHAACVTLFGTWPRRVRAAAPLHFSCVHSFIGHAAPVRPLGAPRQ